MNTKPGTGAYASPIDYRDGIAQLALAAATTKARILLPETLNTKLAPVMMQAQEPACVCHSVVENFKLYWFNKTGEWVDFSPRFLDILCKRFDGQPIDGGTYPRLAFKLLCLYGCATTATLPNRTDVPTMVYRDDSLLTEEVMAEAAKYKAPGYVYVPTDFTLTREALATYGAISSLMLIGDELYTSAAGFTSWADKDIDPLRTPETVISGHQMTPKGWLTPTTNRIRNQWSIDWADKGEANYDPILWAPFTSEQWRIAEIPTNIADMLKTLPKSTDFHYQWNTNLAQGAHNDDVKFTQIAFMILGYLPVIDPAELGWFGPKTSLANYKFQLANGIAPSSQNIGPLTRAALNKKFAL